MEGSQLTVRTTNIFDLELEYFNSIAHTPIETFDAMRPIHTELEELVKVAHERDYPVNKHEVNLLYLKYPVLEFSNRAPGIGEPWSEMEARMRLWRIALDHFGYRPSEKQRQILSVYSEFNVQNNVGYFKFLPQQRVQSLWETLLLRHKALDELWSFALNLKSKRKELTPLQEEDRLKLERFIASQLKENLISYFCMETRWTYIGPIPDLRARAISITESRISSGYWAMPSVSRHKFKFGGIVTRRFKFNEL